MPFGEYGIGSSTCKSYDWSVGSISTPSQQTSLLHSIVMSSVPLCFFVFSVVDILGQGYHIILTHQFLSSYKAAGEA